MTGSADIAQRETKELEIHQIDQQPIFLYRPWMKRKQQMLARHYWLDFLALLAPLHAQTRYRGCCLTRLQEFDWLLNMLRLSNRSRLGGMGRLVL